MLIVRPHIIAPVQKEKKMAGGLHGGSMVKNPPASARDTGSIPDRERNYATEQLNLCTTSTAPVLSSPGAITTEPTCPGAQALQQEKPAQIESSPHSSQLESSSSSNEDPAQPKINK